MFCRVMAHFVIENTMNVDQTALLGPYCLQEKWVGTFLWQLFINGTLMSLRCIFFLFDLILYAPVNSFSVISGWVFLG